MRHTTRRSFALGLAAACAVAFTISLAAAGAPAARELDALFARFDREPAGPRRDKLAANIDAVAHQKYATVSRLYWHTDLASAMAAAEQTQLPILHLRMLGRLDEDLSCANSRLFRATIYPNGEVSRFLREHFVLYWSTERPVPRVTIDYGDGRKLERTIAGNSAHYVLDEHGRLLDVLPGLYAASAFQHELQASLALAARVRGKSDAERAALIVEYHSQLVRAAARDGDRLAGMPGMRNVKQLLTPPRFQTPSITAPETTVSKNAIERRDLRSFTPAPTPQALLEDRSDIWSAMGRELYGLRAPDVVLDAASRALVVRLHNEAPSTVQSTGAQLAVMLARLERTIAADSALNQLRLRPEISREIVLRGGRIDFTTLNAWIYREVFQTPKEDAWLGLLPRDVFSGVPGDGVVLSKAGEHASTRNP